MSKVDLILVHRCSLASGGAIAQTSAKTKSEPARREPPTRSTTPVADTISAAHEATLRARARGETMATTASMRAAGTM